MLFTLIPEAIFEEKNAEKLLGFQSQLPVDQYNIGFTPIKELELIVAYCRPNSINLEFTNPNEGHLLSGLLLAQHLDCKQTTEARVYAHLQDSLLYISVWDDGKLTFANGFNQHTKDDQSYFILYTMEQMELSQHTPVILSGEWDAQLSNLPFNKYLGDIKYWNPSFALSLPEDMPTHALMAQRTIYLCA